MFNIVIAGNIVCIHLYVDIEYWLRSNHKCITMIVMEFDIIDYLLSSFEQ